MPTTAPKAASKPAATAQKTAKPAGAKTNSTKPKKINLTTVKQSPLRVAPGTVVILLAGRFRGRRVVVLKSLPSGLLLVTGPYAVNGVPLRRVNRRYVIKTTTKVDLTGVNVDKIDDKFFAKGKEEAPKKDEKGFFVQEAQKKDINPARKNEQKTVDAGILKSLSNNSLLKKYLGARFSLTHGQKPHLLKF